MILVLDGSIDHIYTACDLLLGMVVMGSRYLVDYFKKCVVFLRIKSHSLINLT